jgi:arabinofuranosyltransferase
MSQSSSTDRSLDWTSYLAILAMLVVVVLFAVAVWNRRWMSDDGLINIRIVRNLLDGYGPVFNIGERVEAYTSPLWLGIIAFLGMLGVRPEYAAAGAGGLLAVVGLALAQAAAIRLRGGRGASWREAFDGRLLVPAGAIVYAALPAAWDYGTSGLESGLTLTWQAGAYLAVISAVFRDQDDLPGDRRWGDWATAALVGLGPLVRPELALYSIAFAVPLVWARGRDAEGQWSVWWSVKLLAAAGAAPVVYQIWRMGYFAALVPNTAVAKSAFESRWQQGIYYTENFYGLYLLVVPMVVLSLFYAERVFDRFRARDGVSVMLWAGPLVAGLAQSLYVVNIGGGFMHGRLFLPGLFGVLLPVAVVDVGSGAPAMRVRRFASVLVVAIWAVVCAYQFRPPKENYHGVGDERGWYVRNADGEDHPITVDDYEGMHFTDDAMGPRREAERRCPVAFEDVETGSGNTGCQRVVYVDRDGAGKLYPESRTYPLRERVAEHGIVMAALRTGIGLRSLVMGQKIHVVDRAGLASPIAARVAIESRGRPGHERDLPNSWMVSRFAAPTDDEPAVVTAGRRALECGRLGRLDRAVTEPLTVGRFLTNITEAFRLRGLTIPRNPHEAEEKFCGRIYLTPDLVGGSGGDKHQWYCPPDHLLAGVTVAMNSDQSKVQALRPHCRRLEHGEGSVRLAGESVRGPNYGGSQAGAERVMCPDGQAVAGLQVSAGDIVEGIGIECGRPTGGDAAGEGGIGFPRATLPRGLAARSRALVAAGGEGGIGFEEVESYRTVGKSDEPTRIECPQATLPSGLAARSGALVDAVGLRCRVP